MTQTGPVTLTVLSNGPSPAEQLTDLVTLGRERGSLTVADVMVALDRADLPPEAIASMLGGKVVWHAERNGQWAAVLHFDRPQEARLR